MWRPCGIFDDSYGKDIAVVRTPAQWTILLAALGFLLVLPLFFSGYVVTTVNLIGLSVVSAVGLNILTGMTGQISLGQGAFMAVGAYTLMMLMNHLGLSFWVALPLGVFSSGAMELFFGLPSLRVKGFSPAMATLATHFLIP